MKKIIYTSNLMLNALLLNLRSRQGFAWMVMAFRFLAWSAIIYSFIYGKRFNLFSNSIISWGYIIIVILMAAIVWKNENWLESPNYHMVLVTSDVIAINYFLYLGKNPYSEVYLFLLIPLITVAYFLKRRLSLIITFLIVVSYLWPLFLIGNLSDKDIIALWLPRSLFLLASTWLYRIQRNLPHTNETYIVSPSKARNKLEKLLTELKQTIPYDSVAVQILYNNRLQIVACLGFDNPDDVYRIEFPADDDRYPNKKVITTKKSQIENPQNYSSFTETEYYATKIKSWLGVPLLSPATRECFGMISIDSNNPNAFSAKEARRASWFAKEASRYLIESALGPAALSVTTKRVNLQKSLRNWANLLPRKTSVWDDDLKAAQELVKLGQKIFYVEDCSIFFVRHRFDPNGEKQKVMHLVASSTIPLNITRRHEIKVTGRYKDGLTGHAVHRNKTLNYGGDQILQSPYRGGFTDHLQYLFSKRSKQVMISPLRDFSGHAIGAIKVENKLGWPSDNPFLSVEQSVFEVYAAMVSLMLESIRQRNYINRQQQSVHNVRALLYPTALKPIDNLLTSESPARIMVEKSLLQEIHNSVNYTKSVLDGILSDSVETLLLENEGMISAVLHYIETLKSMPPLRAACDRIDVNSSNVVRDEIPFRIRVAYYNIAREAILNMARHSKIETKLDGFCNISFSRVENVLYMTIQDNGKGFSKVDKQKEARCFGLRDMDTQVANIRKFGCSSDISIESELNNGTRIHIWTQLSDYLETK